MWSWTIISGSILALIILLALSGRADKTEKSTGGGMGSGSWPSSPTLRRR